MIFFSCVSIFIRNSKVFVQSSKRTVTLSLFNSNSSFNGKVRLNHIISNTCTSTYDVILFLFFFFYIWLLENYEFEGQTLKVRALPCVHLMSSRRVEDIFFFAPVKCHWQRRATITVDKFNSLPLCLQFFRVLEKKKKFQMHMAIRKNIRKRKFMVDAPKAKSCLFTLFL